MTYNYRGKVAIITGSSSGIGKEIALNLAKLGASVVVTGRNAFNVSSTAIECYQVSPTKIKVCFFSFKLKLI